MKSLTDSLLIKETSACSVTICVTIKYTNLPVRTPLFAFLLGQYVVVFMSCMYALFIAQTNLSACVYITVCISTIVWVSLRILTVSFTEVYFLHFYT